MANEERTADFDEKMARLGAEIEGLRNRARWARDRQIQTGLRRLALVLAVAVFAVSIVFIYDDDWRGLAASLLTTGAIYGMARLGIWVANGFGE